MNESAITIRNYDCDYEVTDTLVILIVPRTRNPHFGVPPASCRVESLHNREVMDLPTSRPGRMPGARL